MPADNASKESRAQRLELFVIYILCIVLLGLMGTLWLRQRGFFRPGPVVEHTPADRLEKPIDLNRARWWELTVVRGIGEKRAKEIIELREKRKGFKSIDELSEVPGITPGIIEEMRRIARVGPGPE